MKKNNTFTSLFKADLYRLTHLKCIYIAPVIMFVLIIINYAIMWTQNSLVEGAEIPNEILQELISGRDMLFSASSYIDIGLFMAIICGIFIGGEFVSGTTKLTIARSASRIDYYLSKWLTLCLLSIAYTLASFLICGILTAISGYGHAFDGGEFALLLRAIALQLLIAIASTSLYVLIATLTRTQGATIGTTIALYILVSVISEAIVIVAMAEENYGLLDYAYFTPSLQLTNASSCDKYTTSEILQVVLIPIAYIAASLGIGIPTFIKRDIK